MSREALSLDISRLVSRVVSGEPIDTTERGAALAAKYPDLGMSGALIGQAIERAAGMVGMMRNAPEPVKPTTRVAEMPEDSSPPAVIAQPSDSHAVNSHAVNGYANGHVNGHAPSEPSAATAAPASLPVAMRSIDDDLAAAIDAEIGNLVTGHTLEPAVPPKPKGDGRAAASTIPSRTNGVAHAAQIAPAGADSEAQVRPPAPQTASVSLEPTVREPHASIFSSFRRALFRT